MAAPISYESVIEQDRAACRERRYRSEWRACLFLRHHNLEVEFGAWRPNPHRLRVASYPSSAHQFLDCKGLLDKFREWIAEVEAAEYRADRRRWEREIMYDIFHPKRLVSGSPAYSQLMLPGF